MRSGNRCRIRRTARGLARAHGPPVGSTEPEPVTNGLKVSTKCLFLLLSQAAGRQVRKFVGSRLVQKSIPPPFGGTGPSEEVLHQRLPSLPGRERPIFAAGRAAV